MNSICITGDLYINAADLFVVRRFDAILSFLLSVIMNIYRNYIKLDPKSVSAFIFCCCKSDNGNTVEPLNPYPPGPCYGL